MAKTAKGKTESLIAYKVVKAHDGLEVGAIVKRKAGHKGAEYCVGLGLWEKVTEKKGK